MVRAQSRRRRNGFSITELIVAVAILTMGLGVVYDQFQRSAEPSQRYMHRAQARMLAEKQLAELCASSVASLNSYKPAAKFQKIESDEVYYSKIDVQGSDQITVQVGWAPTEESGALEFPTGQIITVQGARN